MKNGFNTLRLGLVEGNGICGKHGASGSVEMTGSRGLWKTRGLSFLRLLRNCQVRLLLINNRIFFLGLQAGGNPQIVQSDCFRERAVFSRSCPLTRAESLAALFTSLFVVCDWVKPVIFNHFSLKTCAIFSVSWGKVNFVIQTKHLKGESSKSARKTAKVKQDRWLVMSLH